DQLAPFCIGLLQQLLINLCGRGKFVEPMIGSASIDDRDRSRVICHFLFMLGQPWIDLVTPYPSRDVQGCLRIAAGRDGPENLFQIVWIDILIDDDDESSMVAGCPSDGPMGRPHRMAWMGLLQRDDAHSPRVVDRLDIGDTQCFELVPNQNPARRKNSTTAS